MQELVPVVSGFAVGLALGGLRPSLRPWLGAVLAAVLGVLATLVTGEFETTWAFVLVDIPLVAISAVCGLLVAHRVTSRSPKTG